MSYNVVNLGIMEYLVSAGVWFSDKSRGEHFIYFWNEGRYEPLTTRNGKFLLKEMVFLNAKAVKEWKREQYQGYTMQRLLAELHNGRKIAYSDPIYDQYKPYFCTKNDGFERFTRSISQVLCQIGDYRSACIDLNDYYSSHVKEYLDLLSDFWIADLPGHNDFVRGELKLP